MDEDFNNIEEEKREFRVPESNGNNRNNLIYLFIITFVFGIIFVSIFLKGLTPSMDLDIGENPVASMDQRGDEDYNVRAQIDQRLKMIQNDYDMPGVSGYETPEDIVKRLRGDEEPSSQKEDEPSKKQDEKTDSFTMEPIRVQMKDVQSNQNPTAQNPVAQQTVITKIYIGQFSDMNKAVEMQTNIMNAGLIINPMIKEVNGYYTIQAGAYSNYDSAKNVATELNNAGFSAKVVREIK